MYIGCTIFPFLLFDLKVLDIFLNTREVFNCVHRITPYFKFEERIYISHDIF